MNDTLKVAGRIGAELGAAKAGNERLRGLLQQVVDCQAEHYGDGCGLHLSMITLAGRIKDALSQQPEPTDTYTAVDMATAAAQGFRDGQAAMELVGYQFQGRDGACNSFMDQRHYQNTLDDGTWPIRAIYTSISEQSGKFAMHQRVRKTSGSEWQGRICGTYSTALTPEGYAVESEAHAGSVQIYPAKALEAVE